jgi:selenocysteine-specific elongation factor
MPDFGKEPPLRGQVLSLPGSLEACALFHVRLQTPAILDPPIRNAEEVKFHAGTGETPAHVYLLEEATAAGSSEVWATILCDRPVAAARGDRFILRRNAPPSTVAGGWICSAAVEPRRPRKKVILPRLEAAAQSWEESREDSFLERLVLTTMRIDFPFGVGTSELARATSLLHGELTECLAMLEARDVVVQTPGPHWIHRADMEAGLVRMREDIQKARCEKNLLSLAQAEFLKGWPGPEPVGNFLLHTLESTDKIQLRGGKILLSDGLEGLPDQDRIVAQEILGILRETGFASPRPDELPELVKASPDRVDRLLRYLADHGAVYRIGKNVVFDADCMVRAQNLAVEIIREAGTLDSADFKHQIGSSRKYALAILDFLDAKGITQRNGNFRKLAPNYQSRLL